MKTKKKKEQFQIAEVLLELGMDFDVIENISGVTPAELLMRKANIIDFESVISDNKSDKKNDDIYVEKQAKK